MGLTPMEVARSIKTFNDLLCSLDAFSGAQLLFLASDGSYFLRVRDIRLTVQYRCVQVIGYNLDAI